MSGFRIPLALTAAFAAAAVLVAASAAVAQDTATPPKPEMREGCPGLIAQRAPRLRLAARDGAALQLAALAADELRITYIGHSTFLLESPRLVRIATDYNDYVRPPVVPDVVTMNHAHSTHYTDRPDPAIKHVLRGWSTEYGKPARIDMQVQDVRIRNVPTNIRVWGTNGTEPHGNSIFIFEVGALCVAHLGHLHHTLTQQQLDEIGRIDVVMVPVDGSYTLDLDGMVEVLQSLKAPLMIPMHFFSSYTLDNFLRRLGELDWTVERAEVPSVVVSKATLPAKPKVLVLPGR